MIKAKTIIIFRTIELVLLALFFIFIVLFCIHHVSWQNTNLPQQLIYLSYRDVDGLKVGAAVRMMGVQVGYVHSIKIQGEKVNISLALNQPAIKIPGGSKAYIKFTGLVGSKTVEIIPPLYDTGQSNIIVYDPFRLDTVLNTQMYIVEYITESFEAFVDFLENTSDKPVEQNILLMVDYITEVKHTLNQTYNHFNNFGIKIHKAFEDINTIISVQTEYSSMLKLSLSDESYVKAKTDSFKSLQHLANLSYNSLYGFVFGNKSGITADKIGGIESKLTFLKTKLHYYNPTKIRQNIDQVNKKLDNIHQTFSSLEATLSKKSFTQSQDMIHKLKLWSDTATNEI